MAMLDRLSRSGDKGGGTMELKHCPICGKRPKIKRDYGSEGSGFGAWCIIQCKPFLRRPHLKVEVGKAEWGRALKYAIEEWNRRANDV